uniref:Uncharacterized protein n=1 Tax=Panagrolaimus sp. JU765 TaxID=591449 RepID=A0AC34Q3W1_9BILA
MFRPKYPDISNPEYLALCGVHVRKWASIIAIICLVGCVLTLPGAVLTMSYFQIPMVFVWSLIYIAILLADKYEKPTLYIPFLIVTGMSLIFGIIELIILVVVLFIPFSTVQEWFPKNLNATATDDITTTTLAPLADNVSTTMSPKDVNAATLFTAIVIFIIVVLIICMLISFYCLNVVRRARNYMIEEVVSGRVARNYATIAGVDPKRIQELHV